jgi:hypothetical protein
VLTNRRTPARGQAITRADLGRAVVVGIATGLSVSAVMLVAQATEVSQLPEPMAVVFAHKLFGAHLTGRALLPVGLLLHTGWVTAGVVGYVALFRRQLTFAAALTAGAVLWLVAGLVFTPFIGWGLFATGLSGKAAAAVAGTHLLFALFAWALCASAFTRVDPQVDSKA